MSTKTTTDVAAMGRALQSVLALPHTDNYSGCKRPAGEWHGTTADLWWDLRMEARRWILGTYARPHDAAALGRALKKHALELHRDYGVIVTLDGKFVTLQLMRRRNG